MHSIQPMSQADKKLMRSHHPDFKQVEATRSDWRGSDGLIITKTRDHNWKAGQGSNDGGACLQHRHVEINPYAKGRSTMLNYKLLLTAITPRPIALLSTISADGGSTNLAPYSYFNMVNHDPPLFTIGFAGGFTRAKDSLKNVTETQEACINIISEHYLEAANACSINAPYGESEWEISGLHPAPCTYIKASRVKEAIFSIETRILKLEEFESRASLGTKTEVLAILEGVNFWAREDGLNDQQSAIDPNILRPISRLGGITYARTTEAVELLRPDFDEIATEASKDR